MNQIVDILNAMAPVVGLLLTQGFAIKYLPFLKKLSNQLIPLLGALTAFLTMFGATPAHASVFGDIGHILGGPGKVLLSVLISFGVSKLHDAGLKDLVGDIASALTKKAPAA